MNIRRSLLSRVFAVWFVVLIVVAVHGAISGLERQGPDQQGAQ
jgi:hypothetical protein